MRGVIRKNEIGRFQRDFLFYLVLLFFTTRLKHVSFSPDEYTFFVCVNPTATCLIGLSRRMFLLRGGMRYFPGEDEILRNYCCGNFHSVIWPFILILVALLTLISYLSIIANWGYFGSRALYHQIKSFSICSTLNSHTQSCLFTSASWYILWIKYIFLSGERMKEYDREIEILRFSIPFP